METDVACGVDSFRDIEYQELFSNYVTQSHIKEIEQILSNPNESKHYSLVVNYLDLMKHDVQLATQLFNYPRLLLPIFDEALKQLVKKKNCHVRITGVSAELSKNFNLLQSFLDIKTLVAVNGTVIQTGTPTIINEKKASKCLECKQTFYVSVDPEQENTFPHIMQCKTKKNGELCTGKMLTDVEGSFEMADYQEVKVINTHSPSIGSTPMIVMLTNDLADSCKLGDCVSIVGVISQRRHKTEEKCSEIFLLANHIQVQNEREYDAHVMEELTAEFTEFWAHCSNQPMIGREIIIRSVCPQLYGMYSAKLSLLLALIGGVSKIASGGPKIRGEIHLLLVGEPGKSQFLEYGAKLGQRSMLTTGATSGLTVSSTKNQEGEWVLEAGALVLSDGGVCCIDEFNSINQLDRAVIHEAMEQQTISIARAGLVCSVNARTTVIAACNQTDRHAPENDISTNLGIANPLLSRFDLVLILNNAEDQTYDDIILKRVNHQDEVSLWNVDKLKAYIAFVKATLNPSLTPEAQEVLTSYFQKQRMSGNQNQTRTTIRFLESMIRLTQAHARLMFRAEATLVDAVTAIILIECSAHYSAICEISPEVYSFSDDPASTYLQEEQSILGFLGLNHLQSDGLECLITRFRQVKLAS